MTLLPYAPLFLRHETGLHPERAERISDIPGKLEETGLAGRCCRPEREPISPERLARVHSPSYAAELRAFAESGGGYIEIDTVVSPDSYNAALTAAGSVCDAAERVVRGEAPNAFALVRPPGHHALPEGAMGFCLFNNVALGARTALDELGVERLLIVDWDVHHGNGTQAVFWEDARAGFLSIHRWPFYPGTGRADETGAGDGLGATLNLPVEIGISRRDYLATFSAALEKLAGKIRPELVFISSGFDSHRADPVGGLGLETEDFLALTEAVLDVADTYAGGKVVSVLEGGYHPAMLAECVELHLGEMVGRGDPARGE